MAVNLHPLIQLHFLDQQIGALNQNLSRIPSAMQEVDKKLERCQKNVQEKQKLIADNLKKRKELEGDLALIESKRNRYKEQLDTVKTNKEYTALQHEIEGVNVAIREIEDQILMKMEEAEALRAQLEEAEKAKQRDENVLLEEKKIIQTEADKLQAQMDGLRNSRQTWTSQVPQPILAIYERTAKHRRGVAMAEARDAICLECQMRIRPQLFEEIKLNDNIITCESCSRILFYNPPGASVKPEVQPSNP
jgi:predicted  nucleic acid-binding Zn-ribbon protein